MTLLVDITVWGEAREEILRLFDGQQPYNDSDEQAILAAWQRNPRRIAAEVERLSQAQADGRVSWPWSALAKKAPEILASPDPSATAGQQPRAVAVRRYGTWLRNAGMHFDRWPEVEDEIFGERGMLHAWASDPEVVTEARGAWEEQRAVALRSEAAATERLKRAVEAKQAEIEKKRTEVAAAMAGDAEVPPE